MLLKSAVGFLWGQLVILECLEKRESLEYREHLAFLDSRDLLDHHQIYHSTHSSSKNQWPVLIKAHPRTTSNSCKHKSVP